MTVIFEYDEKDVRAQHSGNQDKERVDHPSLVQNNRCVGNRDD